MPTRKEGMDMTLVKAEMSFYHDSVGTKAHGEVFEVSNEQVVSELESAGYVKRVDGQEAQAHEDSKNLQQKMGEAQKLTNEAVSMAHHEQNQETLQHQAKVEQIRQQQTQQKAQQQARTEELKQASEKAQVKKADK